MEPKCQPTPHHRWASTNTQGVYCHIDSHYLGRVQAIVGVPIEGLFQVPQGFVSGCFHSKYVCLGVRNKPGQFEPQLNINLTKHTKAHQHVSSLTFKHHMTFLDVSHANSLKLFMIPLETIFDPVITLKSHSPHVRLYHILINFQGVTIYLTWET